MPQRSSVFFSVYIDGVLSTTTYQPISIVESAGAQRIDHATIEMVNAAFEDLDVSALVNREVEIVRLSNGQVVHWGKITQLPTLLSGESGETLELVSRAELYLLGSQVDGCLVWDPVASAATAIDAELVFNPMIDGVIYGNLNDTKAILGPRVRTHCGGPNTTGSKRNALVAVASCVLSAVVTQHAADLYRESRCGNAERSI
jgi:hypothetical protein